ncbi:MAG: pyridoxamine 5'-phosphate oxidase family protein [Sphingomonadales bacterium]|nr:pyridoxamine 5'-phosphate oxidase family protein [Sphingomonadales bacterium]NCQ21697.1 pyridoxamine 5'-phosphate oxidase family protein [Sphingomonadales bacterium]NCT04409.1 pyridoxamine 5'-phosphate oxidase family protein [Sphingomonadales bacterium]
MATDAEIRTKFWKALKSDRTMFLGMAEGEDAHARPMTAQLDDENYDGGEYHGPVWFFTSTDNGLYRLIQQAELAGTTPRATAHFAAKGHDVWATVHGTLSTTRDAATIDRLWNRFVSAWYEGKDDPKVALIRLDPENAEVWIDASSIVAGIKMLLGIDPKEDYKDKVADVRL